MFHRRNFIAAASVLAIAHLLAVPAVAADAKKFDARAFEAAQAAGKSIVVEVHADWCPVCTKQKPVSAQLRARPEFAKAEFFVVDFDTQKDALTRFKVSRQSTLLAFRGKTETSRSTGVTDPVEIEKLFKSAL